MRYTLVFRWRSRWVSPASPFAFPRKLPRALGDSPARRFFGMLLTMLSIASLLDASSELLRSAVVDGFAEADPERDLAKVVVFDRHRGVNATKAFATGFGVRRGAIATTIGHDSHNLAVMGVCDADMLAATRTVVAMNGGIAVVVDGRTVSTVGLPVAGLMSGSELSTAVAESPG